MHAFSTSHVCTTLKYEDKTNKLVVSPDTLAEWCLPERCNRLLDRVGSNGDWGTNMTICTGPRLHVASEPDWPSGKALATYTPSCDFKC